MFAIVEQPLQRSSRFGYAQGEHGGFCVTGTIPCGLMFIPIDGLRTTTEEDDVAAALANETLTAADRCDRCGAQAYVRVQLTSGLELLFCAHHGREYDAKLRALDAEITDESAKLTLRDSSEN